MPKKRTDRAEQPETGAHATAWNEYDAKVINAFLDEQNNRAVLCPAGAKPTRAVIAWLRGRVAAHVNS